MGSRYCMKRKAIFLDRDGVLNHVVLSKNKPFPPATLEELIVFEDAPQALMILKKAGFLLIGATNQPDVARGKTPRNVVEAINLELITQLALDDIRVCYHDDKDCCACRKPLPGLLLQAAIEYNIDLSQSIMIGDRWKDIEAGKEAGCKTIWLRNYYTEKAPPRPPDFIAVSLLEAAQWIVNNKTLRSHHERGAPIKH
jgi:D-glycero-D-manno-heptose 1,7-bisphosphate phosphatase